MKQKTVKVFPTYIWMKSSEPKKLFSHLTFKIYSIPQVTTYTMGAYINIKLAPQGRIQR